MEEPQAGDKSSAGRDLRSITCSSIGPDPPLATKVLENVSYLSILVGYAMGTKSKKCAVLLGSFGKFNTIPAWRTNFFHPKVKIQQSPLV